MKRFSIQQIRHKWILVISLAVFFVTYLIDLMSPREKPVTLFIVGAIVNYVTHLQVNPFYHDDTGKKQPIFQPKTHQYLFFWGSISVLIGVILFILIFLNQNLALPWVVDLSVTLVCYGAGFYLSFFLYMLLDNLLSKK